MNGNHASTAALLNRLALGTMFLAHGLMKVFVFTVAGTVGFFQSVGFPGWTAYLVIVAEIGGGLALLLGVRTRLVSALLVPVLLGAASVHFGNGWVFSAPNGGWEYPVFLAVSAVVQVLLGDGRFALAPGRQPAGRPDYATGTA
jgi:putative oxidoreductase